MPGEGVKDRRGRDAMAPVVVSAASLLGAPDRPAGRHVRALVLGPGSGEAAEQRSQGEGSAADEARADSVEAADRGRIVVDLQNGLVGRDPCVVGERGTG